jgi:hypothetical protein
MLVPDFKQGSFRGGSNRESPAETINKLSNLDKFKRVKANEYVACCPAHDDNSPSLSITEASDKILVHCFSGCSQEEVLDALKARGMWTEKDDRWIKRTWSTDELDYMMYWCLCYHGAVRRGEKLKDMDPNKLDRRVTLLKDFSPKRYKIVEEDAYRG